MKLYFEVLIVLFIGIDCRWTDLESTSLSSDDSITTESVKELREDIEALPFEVTTNIDDSLSFFNCSDCIHVNYLKHYYAKGCRPVFDDHCKDCPKKFNCSKRQEVNVANDECLYNGIKYKVGETVPVDNSCKICRCGYTLDHNLAFRTPFTTINCITIECPEHFPVHRYPLSGFEKEFDNLHNCYNVYTQNKCCAVKKKCLDYETAKNETFCEYNEKKYKIGEKIHPNEDKCKVCICDENWNPNTTINNSGCYDTECNLEIDQQLKEGCVPIYHENTCCPIDYYCSEKPFDADIARCTEINDFGPCTGQFKRFYFDLRDGRCHSFKYSGCGGNSNNFPSIEECQKTCSKYSPFQNDTNTDEKGIETNPTDTGDYCLVSGNKYKIGTKLDIGQKCVDCECLIPPDFTCIQRSCETPPTNDCRITYSPYECCPKFDCSYNKTNDLPFEPLSCPTPLCEKGCLFETYPDRCPNCVCPKQQEVPDYDLSDV